MDGGDEQRLKLLGHMPEVHVVRVNGGMLWEACVLDLRGRAWSGEAKTRVLEERLRVIEGGLATPGEFRNTSRG